MVDLSTQEILKRLVSFDTTSRLSNLELINWVRDYLEERDVASNIFYNENRSKANLVATIGPDVSGGVVLSGHSDVVPVDGQNWSTGPFELSHRNDGRLYGRGSADMKGFLASMLAHVSMFKAANLKRPVHFAFTYDEEVGCLGIQSLIPSLKEAIALPQLMVIGEPTMMKVANSHKGQYAFRTEVIGRAAHSSRTHEGINAVSIAAKLIVLLDEIAQKLKEDVKDLSFIPSYATINVGPITGGSAFNIVADHCVFEWDMRMLPGQDGQELLGDYHQMVERLDKELTDADVNCGVKTTQWANLPPLAAKPGSAAETLALSLARQNNTDVVAFGTEGGYVQQALDWPVVICGPGDIAQAHRADEFISTEQLNTCDQFMIRLCDILKS